MAKKEKRTWKGFVKAIEGPQTEKEKMKYICSPDYVRDSALGGLVVGPIGAAVGYFAAKHKQKLYCPKMNIKKMKKVKL